MLPDAINGLRDGQGKPLQIRSVLQLPVKKLCKKHLRRFLNSLYQVFVMSFVEQKQGRDMKLRTVPGMKYVAVVPIAIRSRAISQQYAPNTS